MLRSQCINHRTMYNDYKTTKITPHNITIGVLLPANMLRSQCRNHRTMYIDDDYRTTLLLHVSCINSVLQQTTPTNITHSTVDIRAPTDQYSCFTTCSQCSIYHTVTDNEG